MEILNIIALTVSDALISAIQIIVLKIVTQRRCSNSRFAAFVTIAAVTGILSSYLISVTLSLRIISFALIVIDSFRLCLLALAAVKSFSIKNALIAMLIQFMCSLLKSAINAILSNKLAKPLIFNSILITAIPLVLLIMLLVVKKRVKGGERIIGGAIRCIPVHNYLFMVIAVFLADGLIVTLVNDNERTDEWLLFAKVLSLLLIICVAVLIMSLAVSVVYQKYYDDLNQILRGQVKSQLLHYEKREKLNSEIRSFRHDFVNHTKCLESLLKAQKYDEAQSYLEKISGMMPVGEFLFRTGNYIADAILTECQEASAADNTKINFSGYITPDIDSADLCIILSNAMNNAVEACHPMPGSKDITVYCNLQQGIFVLIVKNPTLITERIKDEFPETSKPDKISHGFGFSNMQTVVNKYGGTLHTLAEGGFFTLSITLKL